MSLSRPSSGCSPTAGWMFTLIQHEIVSRETKRATVGLGLAAIALLGSSSSMGAIAQESSLPQTQQQWQSLEQQRNPFNGSLNSSTVPGYNVLYVNASSGSDSSNGSQQAPLRTITRALQVAPLNTIVLVAPGTYSAATGETFPLQLKPGVTIQGNPGTYGQGVVISGGGPFVSPTFASQNVTILGANQAGLAGVTVTNSNPRGYGLWIESTSPVVLSNTFTANTHDGVSVTGNAAPAIRNNRFLENGANGITIYGNSRAEVRENVFTRTGFGINVAQNAAPLIVGNRITDNEDGIVLQANARPTLRDNTIEGNTRDGLVAIAQAQPNLGTAMEPGSNVFRNNGRFDINSTASNQTISAIGNQLASDRTSGQIDLTGRPLQMAPVSVEVASRSPMAPRVTNRSVDIPVHVISLPSRNTSRPAPGLASNPRMANLAANPTAARPTPSQAQPTSREVTQEATTLRSPRVTASIPRPVTAIANPISSAASFPTPSSLNRQSTASNPRFNLAVQSTTPSQPAAPPPSPESTTAAIEIPVPPPASATPRQVTLPRLPNSSSRQGGAGAIATPRQTTPRQTTQQTTPRQAESTTAAIEIPVPPPASATPRQVTLPRLPNSSSRQGGAGAIALQTAPTPEAPIEIPVPPPASMASRQPAQNIPTSPAPSAIATARTIPTPEAPIEIPVPPPASTTSAQPTVRNTPASQPLPSASAPVRTLPAPNAPVEIPVPRPTSGSVAPQTLAAAPSNPVTSLPSSDLLRVPNGNIPLGNVDGMPTVNVSRDAFRAAAGPPPPPSRSTAMALRYRVVVAADNEDQQAQVRSLIPGAFRTQSNGQVMMQVGAYNDRTNADETARMLENSGLRAIVEQLN